jgi:hypothetical protein
MLGNGNLYTEIRNPDGTTPDPTQLQPGYVLWLPAATAPASPGSRGIFFADVDGDGRADAIVVNDNTITVRRSTGNGFGPNEDWTGFPFYANKGTYFADVDGDGRADAIVVNDNTITVRRSTGNGFGQTKTGRAPCHPREAFVHPGLHTLSNRAIHFLASLKKC